MRVVLVAIVITSPRRTKPERADTVRQLLPGGPDPAQQHRP